MLEVAPPAGIDPGPVTEWLRARVPELLPPVTFEPVAGGKSNLTYVVADARGRRWVLRRPPLHSVLPSAHDVGREYRVLRALAATRVPTPPLVGLADDVLDAAFYVMEFVDGVVVRDQYIARSLAPELRGRASLELADTLSRLHAVEPAGVGLERLGRGADYVTRQLDRWQHQVAQQRTEPRPESDRVHRLLSQGVPPQRETTIVHGDFRLDNTITEPSTGTVVALLDWELCTLGDPLADLGVFLAYWTQPEDSVQPFPSPPTLLDGFATRSELAAHYQQFTGRDVSDVGWYVAFAFWRLAAVLEGVYARFRAGAYGAGDEREYAYLPDVIDGLAVQAGGLLADGGQR